MLTLSLLNTARTAVVTQLSWNYESDQIAADVEFLTKAEWLEELAVLLSDLADQGNKRVKHPNQLNSVGATAWAKVLHGSILSMFDHLFPNSQIHAVYPNIPIRSLATVNTDVFLQRLPRGYLWIGGNSILTLRVRYYRSMQ